MRETEEPLLPGGQQFSEQGNRILGMVTKRGVSVWNIIGMNLVLFNSLSLLLFHEVAFVYLLQAKDYFNLTPAKAAQVAGSLIFWSQPFGIGKSFTRFEQVVDEIISS